MLEPLDPEKLRALVGDDDNADYYDGGTARSFFAKDDFAGGMKNLLQVFNLWVPYVYHDKKDFTNWHIHFRDPPFDTLYLRPCGGTIEIFKHDRFLISFGILGRPQNWVRMLQWIWVYGDKVYETNVKKGSMLRPLDYHKLDTLTEDDNDADCDSIRRTKACLGKEKDLARGIMCLFEGWKVFAPCIHRDKEAENIWHVTFRNSPFRSLRIQPSADHGVVDLYAFDKYVDSWHVINNPKIKDSQMWQCLLRSVWDKGRRRQEHKQRWEEMQRLSLQKTAKAQSKSKRTEKPLLHKVLHTAGFKAQRGAIPRAKNMRVLLDKNDDVMEDTVRADKSLSRQFFNQKSPLRATNPNARLGTSQEANDTEGNQTTTKVEIDEANIGGLEIMDCQS